MQVCLVVGIQLNKTVVEIIEKTTVGNSTRTSVNLVQDANLNIVASTVMPMVTDHITVTRKM